MQEFGSYRNTNQKNEDQQKQAKLKQLVEPFILRRTKKEVLTELPDKIENNVIIPFTPEEEKVYLATYQQLIVNYKVLFR